MYGNLMLSAFLLFDSHILTSYSTQSGVPAYKWVMFLNPVRYVARNYISQAWTKQQRSCFANESITCHFFYTLVKMAASG